VKAQLDEKRQCALNELINESEKKDNTEGR
jgi:hypothetical protein